MTALFNAPAITISGIAVFQDADGRYCLNDLHTASGGEKRHRPPLWLENQQTVDLIAELSNPLNLGDAEIPASPTIKQLTPVVTIKGGKGKQGTYVVRELVYAYAMWISPSFHLKVIRTFDAVATGVQQPITPTLPYQPILEIQVIEAFARMLSVSDTSKIRMLASLCEMKGAASGFLPAYVDEPLVRAITPLLKELGHPLGHHVAKIVNPALEAMGILQHLSRKGRRNEIKQFWNLTEDGLQYGRNETSPNNPRETQPLFFVERFPELLKRLEAHLDPNLLLGIDPK